jgi:hypothetical protein
MKLTHHPSSVSKMINEEQSEFRKFTRLDILLTDGLTIVTENSTIGGEIQQNYKSFLELRNVSRNSPTTFQCMSGNISVIPKSVKEAPIFSFKVLGIN